MDNNTINKCMNLSDRILKVKAFEEKCKEFEATYGKKATSDAKSLILQIGSLGERWKKAEDMYGKKVASELQSIVSIDPLLLYDYMETYYLGIGKTQEEIKKMFSAYTHEDWEKEMEKFVRMIKEPMVLAEELPLAEKSKEN